MSLLCFLSFLSFIIRGGGDSEEGGPPSKRLTRRKKGGDPYEFHSDDDYDESSEGEGEGEGGKKDGDDQQEEMETDQSTTTTTTSGASRATVEISTERYLYIIHYFLSENLNSLPLVTIFNFYILTLHNIKFRYIERGESI